LTYDTRIRQCENFGVNARLGFAAVFGWAADAGRCVKPFGPCWAALPLVLPDASGLLLILLLGGQSWVGRGECLGHAEFARLPSE
jgi:hypothetical protein